MQGRRLLPLASTVVLLLCAWLLVSAFVGYGHIEFDVPQGAIVEINGHRIANQRSVKLRPGTYHITTLSAQNFSREDEVSVHAFLTKSYKPMLAKRTLVSIADASVGVSTLVGEPLIAYNPHWFGSEWVVMLIGNSTPDVLATHFVNGHWKAAYRTGAGNTKNSLPSDVASTVNSLEDNIDASIQ